MPVSSMTLIRRDDYEVRQLLDSRPSTATAQEANQQAIILVAVDSAGNQLGRVHVLRRSRRILPIERAFKFNAPRLVEFFHTRPEQIFEISQIEGPSDGTPQDRTIRRQAFRDLLQQMTAVVTRGAGNACLAAMDPDRLSMMRRLGFDFQIVRPAKAQTPMAVMLWCDGWRERLRRQAPQDYLHYFGGPTGLARFPQTNSQRISA